MKNQFANLWSIRFLTTIVLLLSCVASGVVLPVPQGQAAASAPTATTPAVTPNSPAVSEPGHGFVPPRLIDRAELYARTHNIRTPVESATSVTDSTATNNNTPGSKTTFGEPFVLIYDARGGRYLPGYRARFEGSDQVADETVNRAYDYHVAVRKFFKQVFNRNSFDDKGGDLVGTVHYGWRMNNASWNGYQLVYGDGDGHFFSTFVVLDVIGHEVFHAVIDRTSGLSYYGQPGALNEHLADVFGVLFRQWRHNLAVHEDSWLLGPGLFTSRVNGRALRDMRFPGTAYNDPFMGKDTQPAHMKDYVVTTEDDGGVHDNSGIPNRAFALFAISVGGKAWKTAGQIWYKAATGGRIPKDCDFLTFARETVAVATKSSPKEVEKLKTAWKAVGINVG